MQAALHVGLENSVCLRGQSAYPLQGQGGRGQGSGITFFSNGRY